MSKIDYNISTDLPKEELRIISEFKMVSQAKPVTNYSRYYNVFEDYFSGYNIGKFNFGKYNFNRKKILELGPGQCTVMKIIEKLGGEAYGIDMDEKVTALCEFLNMKGETVHYSEKEGIYNSTLLNETMFDGVICIGSISLSSDTLHLLINKIDKRLTDKAFVWIAPWVPKEPDLDVMNKNLELIKSIGWRVEDLIDRTRYTPKYDTEYRYLILKNVKHKDQKKWWSF